MNANELNESIILLINAILMVIILLNASLILLIKCLIAKMAIIKLTIIINLAYKLR